MFTKLSGAFLLGAFVGAVLVSIAYEQPLRTIEYLRSEAVKRGYAEYNQKNGTWQWRTQP